MSIEKWLTILRWPKIPYLAKIHDLEDDEFTKNYYLPPSLDEIVADLTFSLSPKQSAKSDKLIIGKPGCGKTTFIYFFSNILCNQKEELSEKYHFEIIHFNRFVAAKIEVSYETVEVWMLKLYTRYFKNCGFHSEANGILRNEDLASKNSKINAMIDFIKAEREKFRKRLLIFIDDIDEAPQDKVEDILRFMFTFIETATIEKWLTVRGTTLDYYPAKLLDFIKSKFPEKIDFPRVPLHGILSQRISALGENGKNPFYQEFCAQLIKTFNEDTRQALGFFISFLKLKPEARMSPETSVQTIERYLTKNFIKILVKHRVFPNIYLNTRSSRLPIEKDMFLLLDVKRTIDDKFKLIINDYYTDTVKTLSESEKGYSQEWLNVSFEEIKGCLELLSNHHLIDKYSENCYSVTSKGRVFVRVLINDIYIKECIREVKSKGEDKFKPFWTLATINPSFGEGIYF